ncbi:60S ribosomal protein L26 [Tupaia chinensis]|uniref:60S ribosomal protein L26 n=1 Tax=Tupaia chinensis TaxID=246437 RepID=L9LDC5_TUPCH|nr:60S ribosomal protein L26 [Tupaia chinensis]
MLSPLSKELQQKYNVHSMPALKDDHVQVVRGHYRGQQIGKVVQEYRKKYVIYIEWVQREKASGTAVHLGMHPSKSLVTGKSQAATRKQFQFWAKCALIEKHKLLGGCRKEACKSLVWGPEIRREFQEKVTSRLTYGTSRVCRGERKAAFCKADLARVIPAFIFQKAVLLLPSKAGSRCGACGLRPDMCRVP